MNKRVIAAATAGILALLGVLVLFVWAKGANDRAYDGAELITVIRASDEIKQGTKAEELGSLTEAVELPLEAVPDGAIADLSEVSGLRTNAAVAKGEVLVASRMTAPGDTGAGEISVPKGLQELTVGLEAQRALGSNLSPGDTVGFVLSYANGATGGQSRIVVHGALVTRVSTALEGDVASGALITVAVGTTDATKIVNAMEFGKVWLTLQNADTDTDGDILVDPKVALQ